MYEMYEELIDPNNNIATDLLARFESEEEDDSSVNDIIALSKREADSIAYIRDRLRDLRDVQTPDMYKSFWPRYYSDGLNIKDYCAEKDRTAVIAYNASRVAIEDDEEFYDRIDLYWGNLEDYFCSFYEIYKTVIGLDAYIDKELKQASKTDECKVETIIDSNSTDWERLESWVTAKFKKHQSYEDFKKDVLQFAPKWDKREIAAFASIIYRSGVLGAKPTTFSKWRNEVSAICQKEASTYKECKRFFQIDFSATPYDESGSENRRVKHYFPHIVVDFGIKDAIAKGLVKTVVIDKRQEITEDMADLDFRVERDENRAIIGLSEGQRLMLRAGLQKLKMLEEGFAEKDANKHPKMLVMCEDTNVSPYIQQFFIDEGLSENEISRIDSTAKGDLKGDWGEVKQKLFNIDSYAEPRIIISVLMLREGFDVNNICVIVPLRASTSQILLEQTLGRGLRLMWRGGIYEDIKRENRDLLMVKKQAPTAYFDILSIIEHPRFLNFYDDLIKDGLVAEAVEEMTRESVVGDLIKVGLKEDYERYDLYWINIIHDTVEELQPFNIQVGELSPMTTFSLETLQGIFAHDGEKFISQELTANTRFGSYNVNANLFNATSYSEYLKKLYDKISGRKDVKVSHGIKRLPVSQVGGAKIVALLDKYIKERMFNRPFDPAENNNWKILFAHSAVATTHIIEQVSNAIFRAQQQVSVVDAIVEEVWFSEVPEMKMRETYSLPLVKTIYERTGYPSNKGGLECEFLGFLDTDGSVEKFIKIDENQHPFAKVAYIRSDGLLSSYHPDFMVCTADKTYIIETKGDDKVDDENVRRKQRATIEWCEKVNTLPADKRMGREWVYVLLSEGVFYSYQNSGATIAEICNVAKVHKPKENLFE